jgi:hypothetical protein
MMAPSLLTFAPITAVSESRMQSSGKHVQWVLCQSCRRRICKLQPLRSISNTYATKCQLLLMCSLLGQTTGGRLPMHFRIVAHTLQPQWFLSWRQLANASAVCSTPKNSSYWRRVDAIPMHISSGDWTTIADASDQFTCHMWAHSVWAPHSSTWVPLQLQTRHRITPSLHDSQCG